MECIFRADGSRIGIYCGERRAPCRKMAGKKGSQKVLLVKKGSRVFTGECVVEFFVQIKIQIFNYTENNVS